MLNLQPPPEDEHNLRWWVTRIIVARRKYIFVGYESLASRCLRRIFKFSLRMSLAGNLAMDHLLLICAGWRNREWWNQETVLKLGDWSHHQSGRPHARWEDILVEFRSLKVSVLQG